MELLWDEGTKVCSNVPGHLTKMAAMPIYGKNLKKSSSLEPKGQWPWNLVCNIWCWITTKFAQMMALNQYMNLCEYQRSRSFIGLHPRSLIFTFSNFFSLETSRPIEAKFHVSPPCYRGIKVCSNGLCHMTNMAAMSIYGKNLKISSSLEPKGQWPWKLVCSIGYSSTSKFVQIMTLSWPWPILWQGQIWSLMLLYGKKVK